MREAARAEKQEKNKFAYLGKRTISTRKKAAVEDYEPAKMPDKEEESKEEIKEDKEDEDEIDRLEVTSKRACLVSDSKVNSDDSSTSGLDSSNVEFDEE